tara:strand:+ start:721 stop:849 length:129 start_codon:yes stop_codon:yes gene_type:complete
MIISLFKCLILALKNKDIPSMSIEIGYVKPLLIEVNWSLSKV